MTMHTLARAHSIPVWKRIRLGTGLRTGHDFRNALDFDVRPPRRGYFISPAANRLLDHPDFTTADVEIEIALANVCGEELGFDGLDQLTYGDIWDRGGEFGLQLCPAEAGPQLRLQYLDQPQDEDLYLAMRTLGFPESDSPVPSIRSMIFSVEGNSELGASRGERNCVPCLRTRFLFLHPEN